MIEISTYLQVSGDKGKGGSDGNLAEESDDNEEETLPVVTVEVGNIQGDF